jgi:hypothetical protein
MNLLHDLAVDAVANAKETVAVDTMNGSGQRRGDACEQASILAIVGKPGANERDRASDPATPL